MNKIKTQTWAGFAAQALLADSISAIKGGNTEPGGPRPQGPKPPPPPPADTV